MRAFIILLSVLAATVLLGIASLGLALYMGWIKFSMKKDEHEASVTVGVDEDKIAADKQRVVDKVQDMGHKVVDHLGGKKKEPAA